jgi:hypothetical protein
MQMNRVALMVSAGLGVAFLAACSDSPTAPAAVSNLSKPSFAVGSTPTPTPAAVQGTLVVCKTGNVGGSFAITRTSVGASTGTIVASPASIPTGTCLEVANDFGGSGIGSNVHVTEAPAANTVQTITACRFKGDGAPETNCTYVNGGEIFLNSFHGYVITYNNVFTPPPPPAAVCDFSTFGGFTLVNNFNISYGGNAGRVEEGFAYGDLNFVNHTTGDHIHVWNVTGYDHPTSGPLSNYPDSRVATGMGEINESGSFPVEWRFVDLGEPGSNDRVWLKVNGVVLIQEQPVQGGNVQLHKNCKKAPTAEKH